MAQNLYISEFKDLALSSLGHQVMSPVTPPLAEQQVTITASSAQSATLNSLTRFVMVHNDGGGTSAACSLAFGSNPTAVVTAHRMAAGETRFYGVVPFTKIAVITNT